MCFSRLLSLYTPVEPEVHILFGPFYLFVEQTKLSVSEAALARVDRIWKLFKANPKPANVPFCVGWCPYTRFFWCNPLTVPQAWSSTVTGRPSSQPPPSRNSTEPEPPRSRSRRSSSQTTSRSPSSCGRRPRVFPPSCSGRASPTPRPIGECSAGEKTVALLTTAPQVHLRHVPEGPQEWGPARDCSD